ncbi:MAG: arginine--tRNA ligase [Acidobacteria bacterium]|nr:arginine--tRNA ligase [Acidobacteriota bacterium]
MILPIHAAIRSRLHDTLTTSFGIAPADMPVISLELPPKRALGDVAIPVAFELAKRLKKAPRMIAQELVAALGAIDGVSRIDAAPNGYLNFFLDRSAFLRARLEQTVAQLPAAEAGKVIVEHTAINPNKAAHIGHLRNAALGDTLVRLLRFQGRPVEVQNYIDDTGVQVADVVVGFREIEGRSLADVKQIAESSRFDYYCWDLYAKVGEWYEADKANLAKRGEALHAIEEGGNETAEMGAFIADRIVRCHLETMARLNVSYDLLTWEGDILRLRFWATAFDDLKKRGAVFLQTEGKLAGCWVMPIEDDDAPATPEGEEDPEQKEKVIVRSNGVVTYIGKDIANQFWKFGLLGMDFYYRTFTEQDGRVLFATTSNPELTPAHVPPFGKASAVYNVIDTRQAYLQKLLKQALATMGFHNEAAHSTHFAYEMVALSHATARELGYTVDPDGKPFVEVSGRKGLGVKADDLIDRLTNTAQVEVSKRNPTLSADESRATAEAIAVAAVRYFLVKFTRNKVIAFDIDEALSFEGETGPYLQYAVARAGNIFGKLREREGLDEAAVIAALASADRAAIDTGDDGDELWSLVLEAGRLDDVVDQAVRSLELSVVAKYAFSLAQSFSAFYHRQPILKEERRDVRLWRAAAVAYVRRQLTQALNLMGCDVPARM